MMEYNITIDEEYDGYRLDKALSELIEPALSRSRIIKLIDDGNVSVDGKDRKKSYTLSEGSTVTIDVPEAIECGIEPEDIPLDILYEDDDVIVVNKPKGMVVHPAAGHMSGTLVNALMYHCGDLLSGINGVLRPGIVHRIDKDTSGSLIVCKNDEAHASIAAQLKEHSLNRTYRAIVLGRLEEIDLSRRPFIKADGDEFVIDTPIGRHPTDRKRMCAGVPDGRNAVTHVKIIAAFADCTYIECRLETGRTHQIRVHMEAAGYPILGDEVYYRGRSATGRTASFKTQGQTLHAYKLGFIHPKSGEYTETVAPIPGYMSDILDKLDKI